jgi:hypothetical protein
MARASTIVAAGIIAAGFAYVCYVSLLIEPGMGYRTPADYVNPALFLAGTQTMVWYIGELIYIAIGVSCVYISAQFVDRYTWIAGALAGIGFVFIGILDRVFLDLPTWMASEEQVTASVLGFMPLRLATLRLAAVAFGVFAWRVSIATSMQIRWPKLWRGIGYLALLAAVAFVFVLIPMVFIFLVWSVGFFALLLRQKKAESA